MLSDKENKEKEPVVDSDEQSQIEVPSSLRPRFFGQVMLRHRNRKRAQTKKRTVRLKYEQQYKQREQQAMAAVGQNESAPIKTKPTILKNRLSPNTNKKNQPKMATFAKSEEDGVERKTVFLNGNKIEGGWKHGNLHGEITIQYESGEYFHGKYINGVRIDGLIKFKNGSQYTGGFMRDLFHGEGSLKDPSGRIITCTWQQGEPSKKAKIEYPTGQIYKGQIEDLKKHGYGQLLFTNGNKYIGNFQKGEITGHGAYYQGQRMIAQGNWINGVLQTPKNLKQIILGIFNRILSDGSLQSQDT